MTLVREFDKRSCMGDLLRISVTVERYRSRWAIVHTARYTQAVQWGATRWTAGTTQSRTIMRSGFSTKSIAIAEAAPEATA